MVWLVTENFKILGVPKRIRAFLTGASGKPFLINKQNVKVNKNKIFYTMPQCFNVP